MFDDHDDKMLGTTRCSQTKTCWSFDAFGWSNASGCWWNPGSGEITVVDLVKSSGLLLSSLFVDHPNSPFHGEFGMFLSLKQHKKTMIKFIIIWTEDLILWMSIVAVVVPSLFDILGCNPEIIGESPISWYFLPPQKVMPSRYKLVYEPMN